MRNYAWFALSTAVAVSPAVAEPFRRPATAPVITLPAPEGVGCYWYRQRYYCGRYCYWEVNGKRYCREREREAYPQGLVELYSAWPLK